MAAHERLNLKPSVAHDILSGKLAKILTRGASFKLYHVSTPPRRTSAIYSAPPGERSDRTYLESHFLAVSINASSNSAKDETQWLNEVLIYAVEVLIYSTAYSTTFFVSKADSTGYLHLLSLPKGSTSPLKDISTTFLTYLIERRRRPGIRSILALFARSQGQYLFPGSSDNGGKHVLDDRGLIRWWCRVLSPLVDNVVDSNFAEAEKADRWRSIEGYLTVPGLDDHDIKGYIPTARGTPANSHWKIGHPLQSISRYPANIPPRCLIPRFPDDPKSRFLEELDDELTTAPGNGSNGEWRSVKTLDQFWEMMAFRQECSAGRLVGFLWVVFDPLSRLQPEDHQATDSQSSVMSIGSGFQYCGGVPDLTQVPSGLLTPSTYARSSQMEPASSPDKGGGGIPTHLHHTIETTKTGTSKKKKLTGRIIPRQPRVKTKNRMYYLEIPENTSYYTWPADGRGQVVLDEKDYARMHELLLRLDFTNLALACASTGRWINEVHLGPSSSVASGWGATVTGTKMIEARSQESAMGARTLNVGLVRKKRKG